MKKIAMKSELEVRNGHQCEHHYLLEPNKPSAKGQCKRCGERARFFPGREHKKVLSKRVFLEGDFGSLVIDIKPNITIRQLSALGGSGRRTVVLNGEPLHDDVDLFNRIQSSDVVQLVKTEKPLFGNGSVSNKG